MALALDTLAHYAELNRWPAPAKLNLCLYVVGKRDNGYHELETLFQLLDHGDTLSFKVNEQGAVSRSYDLGFSEEVDLCLRAARLLQKSTGVTQGVEISLDKKLPMGGGLGGGSSDAATVLIALNHLWQAGLNVNQLADLALGLGADVPLFVRGRTAWGAGIGEHLTPVSLAAKNWLVISPNVEVSTAKIFSHNRLTARPQMKKIRALKTALQQNCFDYAVGENQLEPIARAEFPAVNAVFEWFDTQQTPEITGPPRLSGSGGTVFAALADTATAEQSATLLQGLPAQSIGFVARGLNFHPLHAG